jgi:DNA-binding CsgD family transcriptional regulator
MAAPDDDAPSGDTRARPSLRLSGELYLVVSVEDPRLDCYANLTGAEKAVCDLVYRGASDQEKAAERATSPSTVANQIRSILDKLGVQSRYELIAKLAAESGA